MQRFLFNVRNTCGSNAAVASIFGDQRCAKMCSSLGQIEHGNMRCDRSGPFIFSACRTSIRVGFSAIVISAIRISITSGQCFRACCSLQCSGFTDDADSESNVRSEDPTTRCGSPSNRIIQFTKFTKIAFAKIAQARLSQWPVCWRLFSYDNTDNTRKKSTPAGRLLRGRTTIAVTEFRRGGTIAFALTVQQAFLELRVSAAASIGKDDAVGPNQTQAATP